MSKELWSNFFAAKKVDEAVQIFTRPLDAKTIRRLIHIARGSDPKITAIRKKVQATDNYDDVCGWGKFFGIMGAAFIQRQAAIRLLLPYLDREPAVFNILWELAQGKHSNITNLSYAALHGLAKVVPTHAQFFLAQYRAPYPRRRLYPKNPKITYADTRKCITAGALLIAGFPYCNETLQEEIKRTVKFGYYKDDAERTKTPYKYSENSTARVRNGIIGLLSTLFFDRNFAPADAAVFQKVFHEHFLEELFVVFRDDASFYYPELSIALHWNNEESVINTFCDYLEKWGGTFLENDNTRNIIYGLCRPEALVTPRLIAAMETVYCKPMDADYEGEYPPLDHIGSWSANEIRTAIKTWRAKKLGESHTAAF